MKIKRKTFITSMCICISLIISLFNSIQAQATDTFDITLTPNTNGYGSVSLDWSNYNYADKNFKVYKSSDGGATYETIGIDYTLVNEVKCLQVYPIADAANQMKNWVQNSDYGKGIIKVDSVYIDDFNANPTNYLHTDSNGIWNYDVVFFGTWDRNNFMDLSEKSYIVVNDFIKSGKGVIFGHDTILNNGRNDIKEYSYGGVKTSQNYFDSLAKDYMQLLSYNGGMVSGNQVRIVRNGLFVNYPNKIGETGTKLSIPASHSWGQYVVSGYENNIWLRYEGTGNTSNNFYLVTYNNCAMIQTGHSNGQATSDEQKILANLIFYCNQLIFNTYSTRDSSAQDLASPNKPNISINGLNFNYSATDNGSTYFYYVESYSKNDTTATGLLDRSNTKSLTVTTGVKKYRYLYDNSVSTVMTSSMGTETTATSIPINRNYKYLHIVAIDGAGNISEISTIDVPQVVPYKVNHYKQNINDTYNSTPTEIENLTATPSSTVTPPVKQYTGFTSPQTQTVTISPDGSTVVNYYYTRNSYNITVSKDYCINDISITSNGTKITQTKDTVTYKWKYESDISLIANLKPDNKYWDYSFINWTGSPINGNKSQSVSFKVPANNISVKANGTRKDIAPPEITYTLSPNDWTNQNVTLTVTAVDMPTDGVGLHDTPYRWIVKENNSDEWQLLYDWSATNTVTVDHNKTYGIEARDKNGNSSTKEIKITNIDKVAPQILNIDHILGAFYNGDKTATIKFIDRSTPTIDNDLSGIDKAKITITNTSTGKEKTYEVNGNGNSDVPYNIDIYSDPELYTGNFESSTIKFSVEVTDRAGNTTSTDIDAYGFDLEAKLSKLHQPTVTKFVSNEVGVLDIVSTGYADKIEVIFPSDITWKTIQWNDTTTNNQFKHEYTYSQPEYISIEHIQFQIPEGTPKKTYQVLVKSYINNTEIKSKALEFQVVGNSGGTGGGSGGTGHITDGLNSTITN